jgi:hypothetical protein
MLAAEMLADVVGIAVDELVDVILLELLDQRYRAQRDRRGPAQRLHRSRVGSGRPRR